VNWHHAWMARLLAIVLLLVVLLGVLYGYAAHCGPWDGIYFAVVTVTTVGYGDLVPHGWAPHLTALAIMVLIIPLWSGSFSLLSAGLTADHVDKRHRQMTDHVTTTAGGGA
jgi:voltage-gated potassium channel